jgi:hypothetical protein
MATGRPQVGESRDGPAGRRAAYRRPQPAVGGRRGRNVALDSLAIGAPLTAVFIGTVLADSLRFGDEAPTGDDGAAGAGGPVVVPGDGDGSAAGVRGAQAQPIGESGEAVAAGEAGAAGEGGVVEPATPAAAGDAQGGGGGGADGGGEGLAAPAGSVKGSPGGDIAIAGGVGVSGGRGALTGPDDTGNGEPIDPDGSGGGWSDPPKLDGGAVEIRRPCGC